MNSQDRSNPDTNALADRLHSTAIRILRRVRSADAATGLSAPRLSLLSVLVFRGSTTISDLAEAEQVTPPTISRMVKDMEWAGLVERHSDPDDGRVQRISATARGTAILKEGRRQRVLVLAAELERLEPEERRAVSHALDVLGR